MNMSPCLRICGASSLLLLGAALSACGGGGADSTAAAAPQTALASADITTGVDKKQSSSSKPSAASASTAGRLLASNCFQCHGTNGTGGFDSIRGGDAKEVLEFLTKPAGSNIMAAHAQGYTREQLQTIIAYLQQ